MPAGWAAAAGVVGSMLQSESQSSAARTAAEAQREAARTGASASQFRPVGISSRFGTSKFQYGAPTTTTGMFGQVTDTQPGQLTGASYELSPEMQAQQAALMGMAGRGLQQYQGAMGATAPMGQAAQGLMGLGQGYLATTPQEQAQKYMAEQQALLAPGRAASLANLQNTQFQQGRTGLATGGGDGMLATNPEMAAYYNAQRMQDLQLASEATRGGQQYAQFGAGLMGTGGDLMKSMYGTQTAAYAPYSTALGGAQMIEGLGQQALDIGLNVGARGQAGGIAAGRLLGGGFSDAARTAQAGQEVSPWGQMLTGASREIPRWQQRPQQQNTWYTSAPGTDIEGGQ